MKRLFFCISVFSTVTSFVPSSKVFAQNSLKPSIYLYDPTGLGTENDKLIETRPNVNASYDAIFAGAKRPGFSRSVELSDKIDFAMQEMILKKPARSSAPANPLLFEMRDARSYLGRNRDGNICMAFLGSPRPPQNEPQRHTWNFKVVTGTSAKDLVTQQNFTDSKEFYAPTTVIRPRISQTTWVLDVGDLKDLDIDKKFSAPGFDGKILSYHEVDTATTTRVLIPKHRELEYLWTVLDFGDLLMSVLPNSISSNQFDNEVEKGRTAVKQTILADSGVSYFGAAIPESMLAENQGHSRLDVFLQGDQYGRPLQPVTRYVYIEISKKTGRIVEIGEISRFFKPTVYGNHHKIETTTSCILTDVK